MRRNHRSFEDALAAHALMLDRRLSATLTRIKEQWSTAMWLRALLTRIGQASHLLSEWDDTYHHMPTTEFRKIAFELGFDDLNSIKCGVETTDVFGRPSDAMILHIRSREGLVRGADVYFRRSGRRTALVGMGRSGSRDVVEYKIRVELGFRAFMRIVESDTTQPVPQWWNKGWRGSDGLPVTGIPDLWAFPSEMRSIGTEDDGTGKSHLHLDPEWRGRLDLDGLLTEQDVLGRRGKAG